MPKKARTKKSNGWFPCRLRVRRRRTRNGDGVKLTLEVELDKRATLGVASRFVHEME